MNKPGPQVKYMVGFDDAAFDLVIRGLGKLPAEESADLWKALVDMRDNPQQYTGQPQPGPSQKTDNVERI